MPSKPPPTPPSPPSPPSPPPDERTGDGDSVLLEALGRLPMFPLPGVVLFPHALLPLHIFEERYRKMARDILSSHRHLAMAMLESADAAMAPGRPNVRPIMGVGEVVVAHELPDGRFNLVVRGRVRVQLETELPADEPYRVITARVRSDLPVSSWAELSDADQSLRALVGRLAERIPEGGELLRQLVASQTAPHELSDALAAALVVDPHKRQSLLEMRDGLRRIEIVTAEVVAMIGRVGSIEPTN